MEGDSAPDQSEIHWVEVEDPCVRQLIQRYLSRREEDLTKLRSFLSGSDFEQIVIQGHNLSGSGAAYGLDQISAIGASLFEAASTQDRAAIIKQIDALEAYVRNVRIR